MPRIAIEAVVEAPWGLVSVLSTHLEFFSAKQRAAQVARLVELQEERAAHAVSKPGYKSGPFEPMPRPAASILCGDFNMRADNPSAARLREVWSDAWSVAHPGKPHPPTFCLFDDTYENEPYCCDFVFVTPTLAPQAVFRRRGPEDPGLRPPAGDRRIQDLGLPSMRARSDSTRARLTPKSRRPRREAERTWIRPALPSWKNSTSSTKRISLLRYSAYR